MAGGACEVLPLRKGGGAEIVLAMLKGCTRSFGEFLCGSHIEGGGANIFHSLKGGCERGGAVLRGGDAKSFRPAIFPFCTPSPPPPPRI